MRWRPLYVYWGELECEFELLRVERKSLVCVCGVLYPSYTTCCYHLTIIRLINTPEHWLSAAFVTVA